MDCPYCGAQMESGVLESAKKIFWSPETTSIFTQDSLQLTEWTSLRDPHVPASRCPACRKIIVSY